MNMTNRYTNKFLNDWKQFNETLGEGILSAAILKLCQKS